MRVIRLWLGSFLIASAVFAQGGPPMRTDDPGTPGDGHFEINVAATNERFVSERVFETPLLDLNYGVGDRVQLKYEVPYLHEHGSRPGHSLAGVKWRFFEKGTLSVSTYPQIELTSASQLLLPIEVAKELGAVALNGEAGFAIDRHGGKEWLAGLAAGRQASERVELLAELHAADDLTASAGGRVKLRRDLLLLLMAGRSVRTPSGTEPRFIGYAGLQFLLGRRR